jgi:hypothetical protein
MPKIKGAAYRTAKKLGMAFDEGARKIKNVAKERIEAKLKEGKMIREARRQAYMQEKLKLAKIEGRAMAKKKKEEFRFF